MKKINIMCCLLVGMMMIFSCGEKEEIPEEKGIPNINLSNLEVGQKTKYIRYFPVCNGTSIPELGLDEILSITLDTLVLEVESKEENRYTFSEIIQEATEEAEIGEKYFYEVIAEQDYLLIPKRDSSQLFWFYGSDTIHLNPTQIVDLVQDECLIRYEGNVFDGDEIGNLEEFKLEGYVVNNKWGVSCLPMIIADMDAYLIYDEVELYISHQISWGSVSYIGLGWHKIED